MQYFRRRKTLRILPWLLACAVVLRSFIAPGYMLSASAEGGLGIIFCDGLVSLVSQTEQSGHHHHHDSGEIGTEVHISPICSKWSTSSLLLVLSPDILPVFTPYSTNQETFPEKTATTQRFPASKRITRGPPLTITV